MEKNGYRQRLQNILFLVTTKEAEEALLVNRKYDSHCLSAKFSLYIKNIKCGSCNLYIARLGNGLINASASLGLIFNALDIDSTFLLGVAGALRSHLKIGDIVMANKIIQHDSKISFDGHSVLVPSDEDNILNSLKKSPVYKPTIANKDLIKKGLEMAYPKQTIFEGTLLSGNEFVASIKRNQQLERICKDALIVDMEAAAVSNICSKLNLPYTVIKTVVDRIGYGQIAVDKEYDQYLKLSANHAVGIFNFIQNILIDKNPGNILEFRQL